jgi:hypothetical protein
MYVNSLQTEIGWGCSFTNLTLHNGVGSLSYESSIFFFLKKSILLLSCSWFNLKLNQMK